MPFVAAYASVVAIPFARQVARFNTHVTNRVLAPLTWYLPRFGRIEHVGRRTGRRYVAPMMTFRSDDRRRLTIALTYGPGADWVQNALAAGEVTYLSRGNAPQRLVNLNVVKDPQRQAIPRLVRPILAVLRVDDFLEGTIEPD